MFVLVEMDKNNNFHRICVKITMRYSIAYLLYTEFIDLQRPCVFFTVLCTGYS